MIFQARSMIDSARGGLASQQRQNASAEAQKRAQLEQQYGGNVPFSDLNLAQDFIGGKQFAQRELVDDPQMQELLAKRRDLAQGYDGQTLGALRGLARNEIAGQQNQALAGLRSAAARSGAGGARGAAMQQAARQKAMGQTADAERKMMLDQAQNIRTGTGDLEKFLFNQKFGVLGTGAGMAQIGAGQRAADAQVAAAKDKGPKGLFQQFGDFLGL